MELQDYFKFENYTFIIPESDILKVTPELLDDLYFDKTESEQTNVFFILLNEYYYLKNKKLLKEVAHVCYLISYYLFVPLTPPASEELALIYAEKAIEFDKILKYDEWLEYVKKGN